MFPYQYPLPYQPTQQFPMMYQYGMIQNMNPAPQQPMINTMFLNQILAAQQMQLMMLKEKRQPVSAASSNRTILLDEPKNIKKEEMVEKEIEKVVEKVQDYEKISQELRKLIIYLTKKENPSTKYIEQNFSILHQVDNRLVSIIVERHVTQKKTKEEQIKFVLRKCFKYLKNKLDVKEVIATPLEIEKKLYQEYFGCDEEMIPFRESSNLKTMNAQYLKKVFQSPRFVEGFQEYLEKFDEIWDEENKEKIDNMVKQVLKLIQNNKITKLQTYRRIPWVPQIKERCRTLAQNLLRYSQQGEKNDRKLIKTDQKDSIE